MTAFQDWAVRFWRWFDDTDIDLWLVSVFILWGTWRITVWAMDFANGVYAQNTSEMSSVGMAAIIAAVSGPYMALQAAAIAFLFKARKT